MECTICYVFIVVQPVVTNNTYPRSYATANEGLQTEVRALCSFSNISSLCEPWSFYNSVVKKNRSSDKWCRVAGMMFLDVSEEHTVFIFSIRGVLPFCTPWVLLMKTTFFRYVGTNQSSGITSHNRNRRIFSPPLHWCKQSPLWSGNFKTVSGQKDTVRYQPYWTYCFVTKIYVIFRNRNLFI